MLPWVHLICSPQVPKPLEEAPSMLPWVHLICSPQVPKPLEACRLHAALQPGRPQKDLRSRATAVLLECGNSFSSGRNSGWSGASVRVRLAAPPQKPQPRQSSLEQNCSWAWRPGWSADCSRHHAWHWAGSASPSPPSPPSPPLPPLPSPLGSPHSPCTMHRNSAEFTSCIGSTGAAAAAGVAPTPCVGSHCGTLFGSQAGMMGLPSLSVPQSPCTWHAYSLLFGSSALGGTYGCDSATAASFRFCSSSAR